MAFAPTNVQKTRGLGPNISKQVRRNFEQSSHGKALHGIVGFGFEGSEQQGENDWPRMEKFGSSKRLSIHRRDAHPSHRARLV